MPARLFRLPRLVVFVAATALAGLSPIACDDPNASIEITATRATRDPAGHVVFEVDIVGHEALGHNVGTYCTQVTFVGQNDPFEDCKTDLGDGDRKTIRVTSENDPDPGSLVAVRLRLGAVDTVGGIAAPPR